MQRIHVVAGSNELSAEIKPRFEPLLPPGWTLAPNVEGANVILTIDVQVTEEMLRKAGPALRAIGVVDSSITKVAPTAAPILKVPRISHIIVAEYTVLLILALARRLLPITTAVWKRQWVPGRDTPVHTDQEHYVFNWTGAEPLGALYGKTVGIVGLGKIGRSVADMLRAFGVRLLYTQRRRLPEADEQRHAATYRSLDDLLRESDFITLHHRLQLGPDGNEEQIGRREIALMKPTAYLINTARGRLVDEAALAEAIRSKKIGGAGIDVSSYEPPRPDSPLFKLEDENVIFTPHVAGGSLDDWWRAVATGLFSQLASIP